MINRDFRDLFAAFVARDVRFVVVGGYAVGFHGHPRYTKDVDLFVQPEEGNARRLLDALGDFGAPVQELTPSDFVDPDCVFQIGMAPNRVDILCGVTGVTFEEVWSGRVVANYGDVKIHYIGLGELVRSKRAAGRPQDLLDADELERRHRTDS